MKRRKFIENVVLSSIAIGTTLAFPSKFSALLAKDVQQERKRAMPLEVTLSEGGNYMIRGVAYGLDDKVLSDVTKAGKLAPIGAWTTSNDVFILRFERGVVAIDDKITEIGHKTLPEGINGFEVFEPDNPAIQRGKEKDRAELAVLVVDGKEIVVMRVKLNEGPQAGNKKLELVDRGA